MVCGRGPRRRGSGLMSSAEGQLVQATPDDAEPVGSVLGRLRRRAGLTGQQFGQMVGMSQAKISRIETGQISASPDDVARLAGALGATDDVVATLVARAQRSRYRMTDWRLSPNALGRPQEDIGKLESDATVIRIFQHSVVVGLVQTAEYAQAVLTSLIGVNLPPEAVAAPSSVAAAVTARVRRQEILSQPGRRFHFVMSEAVLSYRLLGAVAMLGQIERLRQLAGAPNVHVKLLPLDAALPFPLVHGFELLDDTCVIVDVFNTGFIGRGGEDLATYRRVFDRLDEAATSDIEPILRKHTQLYLRELALGTDAAG